MGRCLNAVHVHRLIIYVYGIAMNNYSFPEEACFPI